MMKISRILFSFLLVFATGFSFVMNLNIAHASTTYYVDTSGSDSNTGLTESLPFKTLKHALEEVTNGDKIIMDNGTYTECGPFVVDKYGITITGPSDGGTKIKPDDNVTCIAADADWDSTAFLIETTDIVEPDDELDLDIQNIELHDYRFGIRTEEQTITSNAKLSKVVLKNLIFQNVGDEDITVGSCDVVETDFISDQRDGGAVEAIEATGTIGGLIFTADLPGIDGEAIQIIVVDGANCNITNDTTGACTSVVGNVITTTADLSDANGDDTDGDVVTWAMIQISINGDGAATALIGITGTASGNAAASTTTLSVGNGGGVFLQNLTDITITNVEMSKGVATGIYIEDKNGNELKDISISKVTMEDMEASGLVIIGGSDGDGIDVSDITIDAMEGCGMSIQNIDNASADFTDITITEPKKTGLYGTDLMDVAFDNITITDGDAEGVVIEGTDNTGLEINGLVVAESAARAVSIEKADKLKFTNSTVWGSEEEGVVIEDCEDFSFSGNLVYNNKNEGVRIDGDSNDGNFFSNTIYGNEDYGVTFDGSVEGAKFYSNILYNNEGNDDLQLQDNSDDDDGIKTYNANASSPYKKGNYYAPFLGKDINNDGIEDTGYLPDDSDEHYDKYSELTSAQVAPTMETVKNYTKFNVPFILNEDGQGTVKVKACIREKTTSGIYACTTDTNGLTPVSGVSGVAGKTYDVIVVASDKYGNGEQDPSVGDAAEFTVTVSTTASGEEPADETTTPPVTGTDVPSVVQNVFAQGASANSILLTWSGNNPDEGVVSYSMYRSTDNLNFTNVATVASTTTQYHDANLTTGTTYYYYVVATNSFGSSSNSFNGSTMPGTSNIDENASSNVLTSLATTKTVARSEDTKARLIGNPAVIAEATNNGATSIVTQVQTNDSSNVAAVYPLFDSRYQFISPKAYKMSATSLLSEIEQITFDNFWTVSIQYNNADVALVSEDNLTLAVYNDVTEQWAPVFSEVDSNGNVVTAKTRQLGYFAILAHSSPRAYSDVSSSSEFIGYIGNLTRSGVVQGSGGLFKGSDAASRAELIKMKVIGEGYSVPSSVSFKPCPDVESFEWFAPYFKVALDKGIISGFEDGTCKPFNHVTRAESTKIIIGPEGANFSGSVSFTDAIPTWARPYIAYSQTNGIVNGYSDGTFRANNKITRNEIAKILHEFLVRSF